MPSYISQADIELFVPDVGNYNLNINGMIDSAETDVINHLQYIWFPEAAILYINPQLVNRNVNVVASMIPPMDTTKLNIPLLKNLFIYRALGFYIFPALMKADLSGNDSFSTLKDYYEAKYNEELGNIRKAPIYDINNDGNFDNFDVSKDSVGRPVLNLFRR